ncbi:hypothetical protein SEA_LYMARA_58 [Arthrobacter phage Lymara]|uniref:Uncharacterized protein n=1 Tax=Arthrobacter phage Lymara TaxID=2599828 RepID=A0A5J6TY36_9CAUD|nr:hypothetical protein HYQ01_gp058 [Arthrobacter phage Lymara]QFG14859.1 hypothetical protein SEA_LYMARA_58 [Arthrobacter phage Lymara]
MADEIVEDQDQLDALPLGSVVLDSYGYERPPFDGDVYRSAITQGVAVWWQAGPQGPFHTVCFPAKVLHKGNGPTTTELFLQGLIST